ncbi:Ser/Thr protein phosphatase [Tritrichomonas foetus]|uniref:Serine/threonine-protein phosphatase n=1 Tax=Tritrichomonas foetus TaxID=1144522 RepID=A0A1J4JIY9_9EUKA|nr:Ser/Thr protein phosphatase [Tritrichomonas foetus]|eukprot:OHS99152.1 Ser/Thr protein phosphatase [Tritrichomonas foetus]
MAMRTEHIFSGFQEILSVNPNDVTDIGRDVFIPFFELSALIDLCQITLRTLKENATTLMRLDFEKAVVVGDLHGNFHDLIRILNTFGLPPQTQYVFLGDYVDRGSFSIEVITLLFTLYSMNPQDIILLRGNHEFPNVNDTYGFLAEVESAYNNDELWIQVNEVFNYLPIAALLNKKIFCIHGGLAPEISTLEDIEKVQLPLRLDTIPSPIKMMLWSDPTMQFVGFAEHIYRGEPLFTFGIFALQNFQTATNTELLLRGHQCVKEGVCKIKNKGITVFSSSFYQPNMKNKAGVVIISKHNNPKIVKFSPIPKIMKKTASFFQLREHKYNPISIYKTESLSLFFKNKQVTNLFTGNKKRQLYSNSSLRNFFELSKKATEIPDRTLTASLNNMPELPRTLPKIKECE